MIEGNEIGIVLGTFSVGQRQWKLTKIWGEILAKYKSVGRFVGGICLRKSSVWVGIKNEPRRLPLEITCPLRVPFFFKDVANFASQESWGAGLEKNGGSQDIKIF